MLTPIRCAEYVLKDSPEYVSEYASEWQLIAACQTNS